ncbi:MAG: RagB/SusD family nutrient uptake outer membrane protein [Paludibacter sp.]
MKIKNLIYGVFLFIISAFAGCNALDIEPLDKISADKALSDKTGIYLQAMLATLYRQLPVEDFTYYPDNNNSSTIFNFYATQWGGANYNFVTDDAYGSNAGGDPLGNYNNKIWTELYLTIRQVNIFSDNINIAEMDNSKRNWLKSEASFIRAYCYFQLVKRFGGVPLIYKTQTFNAGGDNSEVFVARSTEKETWDFVLAQCDSAVIGLPATAPSVLDGANRATKWAAYALKSRASLHAASVAKYWDKALLAGDAVTQKLVGGMTIADANNYYKQCIDASQAIFDNAAIKLYKPTPSNATEAGTNYQAIFRTPRIAATEVIFSKAYVSGVTAGSNGHWMDWFFNPNQVGGYTQRGRFCPTLDLIDVYEDYSDNGIGASVKLVTRTDGDETDYTGTSGYSSTKPYLQYANVTDIFKGKDARLFATIITPGSTFAGVKINIQGGLKKTDGKLLTSDSKATGADTKTYYTYGDASDINYSGFKFNGSSGNFTTTGFLLRKFMIEGAATAQNASITPFVDFRLAEIYLNYAEAVVESGQGDAVKAATLLNAIRHRAAHKDDIPSTIPNIMKERRVELALEGFRYWDLVRRRDMVSTLNGSKRKALIPILDISVLTPTYFFVRSANLPEIISTSGRIVQDKSYYMSIPGITSNFLVQNPQY